ncbi:hypothetical protein LQW54_002458 [Pestalotiopsis sp. IQ-011]
MEGHPLPPDEACFSPPNTPRREGFAAPSNKACSSPFNIPDREGIVQDHPDPLRSHPVPRDFVPPVPKDFKPPSARNFSFSVSGLWKSNGNMLRWITEVPSVHSDLNAAPGPSARPKHSLNQDDAHTGHDGDQHRNKKAKADGDAPTLRRRDRIVSSTVNAAHRLSSGWSSVFSSARPSSCQLTGMSIGSSGAAATLPSYERPHERMRLAVVGDQNSGKTNMLLRWYFDSFDSNWYPTSYELYSRLINVDGKLSDLEIWDTSGNRQLHQLSMLSYLQWDAVFLCFSINSDRKFMNAQSQWLNELHMYCPRVPIFLVGLKIDTRNTHWSQYLTDMQDLKVSAPEGDAAAYRMGAVKYLECSAKTGAGVEHVFEEAVRCIRNLRSGKPPVGEKKEGGFCFRNLMCS